MPLIVDPFANDHTGGSSSTKSTHSKGIKRHHGALSYTHVSRSPDKSTNIHIGARARTRLSVHLCLRWCAARHAWWKVTHAPAGHFNSSVLHTGRGSKLIPRTHSRVYSHTTIAGSALSLSLSAFPRIHTAQRRRGRLNFFQLPPTPTPPEADAEKLQARGRVRHGRRKAARWSRCGAGLAAGYRWFGSMIQCTCEWFCTYRRSSTIWCKENNDDDEQLVKGRIARWSN